MTPPPLPIARFLFRAPSPDTYAYPKNYLLYDFGAPTYVNAYGVYPPDGVGDEA